MGVRSHEMKSLLYQWRFDENARLILKMKESISVEELCNGLPSEFAEYMNRVRTRHAKVPNYSALRKLFAKRFLQEGFEHDNVYLWTQLLYEEAYGQPITEAQSDDQEGGASNQRKSLTRSEPQREATRARKRRRYK